MTVILLKSILAGVGAALVTALVIGIFLQGAQYRAAMFAAAGEARQVQEEWHICLVFGASVLAFAAGFWSQYRKAR